MGNVKLNNIKQITYAEYKSLLTSYKSICTPGEQNITWVDDDNDGYGWVFCGGPIIGGTYGVKGTIELIVGGEGDYGRKSRFDEYYALIRYLGTDKTPTRTEYVTFLNKLINNSSNPTNHVLYGYNTKYQNKVTDEQFSKLVSEFKGYIAKPSTWGWTTMAIQHSGHNNNGAYLYTNGSCYDSNNNHFVNWSDGIKTDCDLCGAHYTGNENYTSPTWYVCSAGAKLQEGQTVKCSGHAVYGIGNKKLGTCYDTYTKINGVYYRTKVEMVPEEGFTASSNCTTNLKMPRTSAYRIGEYGYYGQVTFTNGTISRSISCGFTFPSVDEKAPTITKILQDPQTYKNDWVTINQITINGIEEISDTVYVTIKNKEANKIIVNNAAVLVENGGFKYVSTPALEGTANGTTYTVTVTDRYNNTSSKDITVYKTDGTAPSCESSLSYTNWSSSKTVNLKFTDYGSGGIQVSFNNQTSYETIKNNGDGTYSWSKTFNTEQNGTTDYKVYVKDGLGNATVYTLTVGNIDKTKPKISLVKLSGENGNYVVTLTGNDELSGIAGYAVTNSNIMPTVWSTERVLTFKGSKPTYVWLKDKAGNVVSKNLLTLSASANNGANNGLGAVDLDWSTYTEKNVVFKGYSSNDNGATWQSISLMDYTDVKTVKVLQVYPVAETKNQLKTWMETNGYGKGILKIDSVYIDDFNNNPNTYLKDSSGNWKYDVLYFGTWDDNGGKDLSQTSFNALIPYINDGRGVILGHDTLASSNESTINNKYFNKLAPYFGVSFYNDNGQYSFGQTSWNGSNMVRIAKKGLITNYPWSIGDVGTTFHIPYTHNSGQYANKATIWLDFGTSFYPGIAPERSDLRLPQSYNLKSNFYISTYNNCAMLMTGDSNGKATEDEQKILANLIFYCYQLSDATTVTDNSSMDITTPNKPTITEKDSKYYFSATDNGTTYKHYIEAYNKDNMNTPMDTSNTTTTTVTSGIKNYRYLYDNNKNTKVTLQNSTETTSDNISISNEYGYLHVAAIDNAGNISDTTTIANKYKNVYDHWAWGFKNEGNNSNKTAYLLQTTYGEETYGEEFTPDASYGLTVPNGFYLAPRFGNGQITGKWTTFKFGTKITQPSYVMNFEYDYYPTDYTITYNLNGGTNNLNNPSTYNVLYGVTFSNPTKTGYDFAGWYDSNGNKITGINEGCNATFNDTTDLYSKLKTRTTGNISVTAKWKRHDYSITTNKTGSGAISSGDKITYTKNTSVYIIPAEGYTTSSLKIDGVSVNPVTKYNFLNVEKDHKVEATFTISQSKKMELMQKGYSWIDLKSTLR